jgi:TnpA family transposase
LGFRFCPRLRDFPERKFACDLQPLFGPHVRTDVIREYWDEVLRLVASLRAGTVLSSAMLKRLARRPSAFLRLLVGSTGVDPLLPFMIGLVNER